MNWMCSSLDAYRLVSNSDAHSPPALGREATTFRAAMDFFSIAEALRTGDGLAGTIEFYPEEGKYHLDGHRKCGIRFEPGQTRARDGACPECHKPLTIGVLHRVAELADRPDDFRPEGAADFKNLVPLAEIISEMRSVGPKSKSVNVVIDELVAAFGPELAILQEVPRTIWPVSAERRFPRRLAGYAGARSSRTPDTTASMAGSACSVPASSTMPTRSSTCRPPQPVTRKPAPPATGNEPGQGDNAAERRRGGRVPAREAEEERRLLFVGMTRARTRLFLSCAAHRGRPGGPSAAGPSPFLAAIDPALLSRPATPNRLPPDRQLRLL